MSLTSTLLPLLLSFAFSYSRNLESDKNQQDDLMHAEGMSVVQLSFFHTSIFSVECLLQ